MLWVLLDPWIEKRFGLVSDGERSAPPPPPRSAPTPDEVVRIGPVLRSGLTTWSKRLGLGRPALLVDHLVKQWRRSPLAGRLRGSDGSGEGRRMRGAVAARTRRFSPSHTEAWKVAEHQGVQCEYVRLRIRAISSEFEYVRMRANPANAYICFSGSNHA